MRINWLAKHGRERSVRESMLFLVGFGDFRQHGTDVRKQLFFAAHDAFEIKEVGILPWVRDFAADFRAGFDQQQAIVLGDVGHH